MASKRDQILSSVAADRVRLEIRHWFSRFSNGFIDIVSVEDCKGLIELIELRQEFSEASGPALPDRPAANEEDVVDCPAVRGFVGMGM